MRAPVLHGSLVAVAALVLAAPGAAAAAKPAAFAPPVQLRKAAGGDEPRIAIAPGDRRYVVANDGSSGEAVVYASTDRGASWTRTPSTFPGQQSATIDTDIVATHTGRIVATELDGAGLTFVTGYSDDGGRTWTASTGTSLPDIDRPWLAVGPDDPHTHKPRVYLLFHNLASGLAQHNMYVSTSTDGGASFGAPVPLTLPGSQAYSDLQCADSGAPSSLNVNPRTGQIYAMWGTRTSVAGGCGASVFATPEANVVGETRVWVATSHDGSAGSWTSRLAVDAGDKTVSASFEAGAIDRAGNVYVAYAQTAHTYPDFARASVRYVSAPADLHAWSKPHIVAPSGPVGHYDPSLVAGDRGELALAYYTGVPRAGGDPAWYVDAALVHGADGGTPQVQQSPVSDIPAYAQSANAMGGSCASGPAAGLENGLACNRATDDWGLALDSRCRLSVVFPTVKNKAAGSRIGTFVSTQRRGGTPCPATGAPPWLPGTRDLARRIEMQHLHGSASELDERAQQAGYVGLWARTSTGTATNATAVLHRLEHGRQVVVARLRNPVKLTTSRRTLRLALAPGAHLAAGRYESVVSATVAGVRVRRTRTFTLH